MDTSVFFVGLKLANLGVWSGCWVIPAWVLVVVCGLALFGLGWAFVPAVAAVKRWR
jgi:hypothetical protein